MDRRVAIKLLRESLGDEASRERFRREALLTSKIRHPSVVQVFEHGIDPDGTAYIVYELVPGADLGEVAAKAGRLDLATLAAWVLPVAGALEAAHRAGVIHRDVKPQNVLVADSGRIVLCDFGIARPEGAHTVFTAEGLILGTPAFLAPELWIGAPPTPASDQFAWAASIYLLVFGVSVYGSDDPRDVSEFLRTRREIVVPRGREGALGPAEPVVLRALAREPARRYPDMSAYANAFEAAVAAEPGRGFSPGPLESSTVATVRLATSDLSPSPRRSWAPVLAAGAALIVSAVVILSPRAGGDPTGNTPGLAAAGTPTPAEEAWAALIHALDKLQELLGENPVRLRETPEERFERYLGAFEDPLFPPRWNRFVAALGDWLQTAGPPAPDREADRAGIEVLDRATRIAFRVAQAMDRYAQETHAVPVINEMGGHRPRFGTPAQVDSRQAFVDSLKVLFPGLEDRKVPRTPRIALLEALLAYQGEAKRRRALLEILLETISAGTDRSALMRMCYAIYLLLPQDLAGAELDRAFRRRLFDVCLETSEDPSRSLLPLWRAMIRGLVLREAVRQAHYPGLTEAMVLADVDFCLGVAELLAGEMDSTTAWILQRAADEALKIMDSHPLRYNDPAIQPLQRRMRELLENARKVLGERSALGEAQGWEILAAEGL